MIFAPPGVLGTCGFGYGPANYALLRWLRQSARDRREHKAIGLDESTEDEVERRETGSLNARVDSELSAFWSAWDTAFKAEFSDYASPHVSSCSSSSSDPVPGSSAPAR